jgi:hypothetical protein
MKPSHVSVKRVWKVKPHRKSLTHGRADYQTTGSGYSGTSNALVAVMAIAAMSAALQLSLAKVLMFTNGTSAR